MWTANDVCHCDWWAQQRQLRLSLKEGGSHRNHCSTTSHVPTKGFASWNFSVPFHLIWQSQQHVVWQQVLENTAKQKWDDVIDAVRQTAALAPQTVPSSITYVPNRVGPKSSLIPKNKNIDQPHRSIKIIDPVKPTELFSENIKRDHKPWCENEALKRNHIFEYYLALLHMLPRLHPVIRLSGL